jgi:hypothetical protein
MTQGKVPNGPNRYDGLVDKGKGWGNSEFVTTLIEMLILLTTAHSKIHFNLHIYVCMPLLSLSAIAGTSAG